ncbi:MAG: site-specific DNA-methyltransferase [Pseudomonadota bacterium]
MKNEIQDKDVLEFLRSVESNSVDLIIADPPYGIKKDFGLKDSWKDIEDWALWCEKWLTESSRILKDTGSILVYGIHHYICYNQISLYKLGMKYRRQFIWHYENGFCGNRILPRATYEPLLWFTKGDDFNFSEIREPYKSEYRLRYKIKKKGKIWQPNPNGRMAGDVWNIPTLAGRRFQDEKVAHPTQKPLAISERLVKHFSPVDGMIVIPFCGSGSECVAAFKHGRSFLATDINSQYRTIAETRLVAEGWIKPTYDYESNASGERFTVFPARSAVSQ